MNMRKFLPALAVGLFGSVFIQEEAKAWVPCVPICAVCEVPVVALMTATNVSGFAGVGASFGLQAGSVAGVAGSTTGFGAAVSGAWAGADSAKVASDSLHGILEKATIEGALGGVTTQVAQNNATLSAMNDHLVQSMNTLAKNLSNEYHSNAIDEIYGPMALSPQFDAGVNSAAELQANLLAQIEYIAAQNEAYYFLDLEIRDRGNDSAANIIASYREEVAEKSLLAPPGSKGLYGESLEWIDLATRLMSVYDGLPAGHSADNDIGRENSQRFVEVKLAAFRRALQRQNLVEDAGLRFAMSPVDADGLEDVADRFVHDQDYVTYDEIITALVEKMVLDADWIIERSAATNEVGLDRIRLMNEAIKLARLYEMYTSAVTRNRAIALSTLNVLDGVRPSAN